MSSQNFYEPMQAAKFLNVSLPELWDLTHNHTIKIHKFKGREYYLGGELDYVKSRIFSPIALLPSQDAKHDV